MKKTLRELLSAIGHKDSRHGGFVSGDKEVFVHNNRAIDEGYPW